MPARPYVTLHKPMGKGVTQEFLATVDTITKMYGLHYWISARDNGDVVVMVDVPQIWHDRAANEEETEAFKKAVVEGDRETYLRVLHDGLLPRRRPRRKR